MIADPSPTTKGWKQLIGARAGLELVDMSAETIVTALPDAFAASSVDTGARRWTIEKTGRAPSESSCATAARTSAGPATSSSSTNSPAASSSESATNGERLREGEELRAIESCTR